ncbi:MAG: Phytanoyl-CoA dioxygenase (PhyH) [Chloroflexi bacterium ADurb.Bin325]|nr:MAG: Phytanoyl-CoA dioxygenase (PhyH) [Chloroflexi bacterium ADurb.Bin325]
MLTYEPTLETAHTYPTIGETEVEFFQENGYLIVHNALSGAEVEELRRDAVHICRGDAGDIRGVTRALPGETDDDVMQRYLCIHFPHKLSDIMCKYLAHPVIVDVLTHVIGPDVKCMQSMLFIKAAGKPGQAWHQDEDFIPTRDRSLTGAWIAMDHATVENGCLWVIPGSHKAGILWEMDDTYDARFDCTKESKGFPYRDEDAVPVEIAAGSIVFFNGYLLHRSLPNVAATGYRRSLVNHYMSASSLLPWHPPQQGEGMAVTDYRDIVMIAGNDPYAYKGITDLAVPHVRPTRNGGCANPALNLKTAE